MCVKQNAKRAPYHQLKIGANDSKQIPPISREVASKAERPSNQEVFQVEASSLSIPSHSIMDVNLDQTQSSSQIHLKRLRDIQLKYGPPKGESQALQDSEQEREASKGANLGEGNTSKDSPSVPETMANVTALRERMARLREEYK